jgi:hypothetical protein
LSRMNFILMQLYSHLLESSLLFLEWSHLLIPWEKGTNVPIGWPNLVLLMLTPSKFGFSSSTIG